MINLQFRGWGREVYPHNHKVQPIKVNKQGRYQPVENRPLTWKKSEGGLGFNAYGKVRNLSLNGNFLVRFEMNKAEIHSLLRSFIKSDPVTALELLSGVQIEVIKSLQESSDK